MPAEFDPYRDLLGIVTPTRPPDHYALLDAIQKVAYDEVLRTKSQRAKLSGSGNQNQGTVSWKQQPLIITAVVGTVVLLLLLGVFFLRRPPDNANLIIDWPPGDRVGGRMYIDAKPQELPLTEPLRISVSEGPHRIEFQRDGYRKIEQRIQVAKHTVRLKLHWIVAKP